MNRILGHSPQDNALFPYLTLEENLEVFAKLNHVKNKDYKKKKEFLLKRLDIFKSKDKKINELSGGMQKRADLAITLINSPKIIVLDEPFNGLDISLQRFIWDLLRELAKNNRIVIISSHLLSDIQKNCNKIGLVENGIYYDSNQIIKLLNGYNNCSLESFLKKVFDNDLRRE